MALPAQPCTHRVETHACTELQYEQRNQRPTVIVQTRNDDYGFHGARDIAIGNSEEIYTAFNYHCHVYTTEGEHVRQFPLHGKAGCPNITLARNGSILVSDWQDHHIYLYTSEGELVRKFGNGQLTYASGIVMHDNQVYVADRDSASVKVFTMDGELLRTIGDEGLMEKPIYLAFNRKQELMVSDCVANAIFWFDREGKFLKKFRGEGENDLRSPWGFCEDASGNLLTVNQNGERLDVFTDQLKFRCSITPQEVEFADIWGLALTKDGKIVVADLDRKEIMII